MMFLLKMVNYSMSFPSLSTSFFFDEQVGGTILDHSYFLNFFVGPLLHALKLGVGGGWVVVVVVAYRILVSAPVPFCFVFLVLGLKGFGTLGFLGFGD